jgi:predicted dehydrogenase
MAASFALIGVGGIGAYHLASIRKLEEQGLARLVGVADPTAERFPDLKREFESRGVRWHLDYRDMLRGESDLDAVTIATPIPFHGEMTLACLKRGVFVNLEKPPVPLVQQLDALIEADAAHRVTVGFQMILSRCVQRMKQLIVEGAIGEIRSIRVGGCWPRLDPYYRRASWAGKLALNGQPVFDGPATNAFAHLIHNIMFLASPAAADFAVPIEVQGELYRARPIESYDVACLRGTFASGVDFCLAVTHATKEGMPFKLEAQGTRGWLRLSDDGANLEASSGEFLRTPETTQQLLDVCYDRFSEVMRSDDQRTYTTLKDTLGYVRATNGLLLSSGGIHDIGAEWVDQYQDDAGEVGFDVRGLRAAVEQAFTEGRLFSELGLEWARARPVPVRLDSFQIVELPPSPGAPSFGQGEGC